MTQSMNRVRMSENNSQTDSQEETSSRIPEREEDEFQLRRRRIADVFMAAYGRGIYLFLFYFFTIKPQNNTKIKKVDKS